MVEKQETSKKNGKAKFPKEGKVNSNNKGKKTRNKVASSDLVKEGTMNEAKGSKNNISYPTS